MREAVIIDAVRTPIGRYNGALRDVRPDDLAAHVIRELLKRNPIDPSIVDDVIFGCTNQAGEDNRNVARMAVLLSGMPETVPGVTVNRLCASGLEALNKAASAIKSDLGDVFIAGGTESMTRAPYVLMKPQLGGMRQNHTLQDTTIGWRFVNPALAKQYPPISLGETAENVADRYGISREEQDEFALLSQNKANNAIKSGRFKDEIVPIRIPQPKGDPVLFDTDEHPRPDTTLEKLAQLKPAFKEGGTVTAGNSSGINDGASALLIMEKRKAEELGLKPMARIVTSAVSGVHPSYMGIGPIPATKKALQRAGLSVKQIDLIEINEAFASQSIACIRELGFDMDKVNVNGGAIALGHPLGCSGARIVTTLIHEMKRRDCRYGLATMCVGVGQGIATIIEKL
ncbi:acetyl-CoA acetyltransferase [Polycladomyces abyssicola]|uniref:acetyl-CoA C-acyltransferase n=1 Tax=Polycladomyces abyssicola TaxID=1125966 RepID=A0A8D5UE09_9BACL|nr:thiolase family protein [Polycladomyces abyssicola]BCU80604.1 acetyl-CoA acetyltransferase [Polycladomyces abyssicola]